MIAFMVAGTASGVGKTTVALCCMAALRERGLRVQPFKCGPDFLDAGHHSAVCGRAARNLDAWMMDPESNRRLFAEACRGADAAVIEGVMGLYDGADGASEQGSSAQMAKLLGMPVVLVLDASRSARSVAAVLQGFTNFDPGVRIAGAVLNGVAGTGHERLLREAIGANCSIPVLGCLPHEPAVAIPERHLGLYTAEENHGGTQLQRAVARFAGDYLNLEPLLGLSPQAFPHSSNEAPVSLPPAKVRIGVARDRAFSFYYEDNFDLLRGRGAELVFFSPLRDCALPGGLDALYLGGGYPELHADALSGNAPMLEAMRSFAATGRPVYAECGGAIYLGQSLSLLDGRSLPMAGVLPIEFEMTSGLQRFGYAEGELAAHCLLGGRGTRLRGHSFHCSRARAAASADKAAYRLRYSLTGKEEWEGYRSGGVFASYLHVCFRSHPALAANFVHGAGARASQEATA